MVQNRNLSFLPAHSTYPCCWFQIFLTLAHTVAISKSSRAKREDLVAEILPQGSTETRGEGLRNFLKQIYFAAVSDWNHIDIDEFQFLPLLPCGNWSKLLDLFKPQFYVCTTGIPIAPTSEDGCEDNVIICLAHSKHSVLLVNRWENECNCM